MLGWIPLTESEVVRKYLFFGPPGESSLIARLDIWSSLLIIRRLRWISTFAFNVLSFIAFICSQPRDSGQQCSTTAITRYFFNVATRNCEVFSYNGCGGNRNNFATVTQCLNYCNSASCPPGTIALRDTSTNTLTACQAGVLNTCPTDYTCANSQLLNQAVCCGVPASTGKCPAGQSPYFDAWTNAELQCQPNIQGSCPGGYFCYYSTTSLAYYCCGTAASMSLLFVLVQFLAISLLYWLYCSLQKPHFSPQY